MIKIVHKPKFLNFIKANGMAPLKNTIWIKDKDAYDQINILNLEFQHKSDNWANTSHLRLFCHELVHVKQYNIMGPLKYYWKAFTSIFERGYHNDPLEKDAYDKDDFLATYTPKELSEWFNNNKL